MADASSNSQVVQQMTTWLFCSSDTAAAIANFYGVGH